MRRAFTLVEMLVVIGVLVILAGAVVAIGGQVKAASARRATLATLKTCEALMAEYLAAGNPEPTTNAQWLFGTPPYHSQWKDPWNAAPPAKYLQAGNSDLINWNLALASYPPTQKAHASLPNEPLADEVVRASNVSNPIEPGASIPSAMDRVNPNKQYNSGLYMNAWNSDPTPLATPGEGKLSDWPADQRRGTRFKETIDKNGNPLASPIYHFSKADYPVVLDAWGTPIRYVPSERANGTILKSGYFMSAGPDGVFYNQFTQVGNILLTTISKPTKNDDVFSTDPQ